jgi:predicted RNA-binding protein YlqC (UPF0109 family)
MQEAIAAGHVHLQVPVSNDVAGLVIGRHGATIMSLQKRTGAMIQVPPETLANPGMRMVNITHPSAEGAFTAKRLIFNTIAEHLQQTATGVAAASLVASSSSSSHMVAAGQTAGVMSPATAATSVQILVPVKDVGLCIGRQGCVIKHMQACSQTRIHIPERRAPAPNDAYSQQSPTHCVVTILGSPEGCAMVQEMIGRIMAEHSSAGVMGHSAQHQPHGKEGDWQQQQLQPSQGE